jgi:hypothetical protein
VIEALRKGFQQKAPKAARVREMLERASTPNRDGLLEPYCQVAVHYLTKKLRQLEGGG